MKSETPQHRPSTETDTVFPGFEPLTSNYVYCPNQFLDLCIPNCSRGAVRIVGFLLRETLGWLDSNGTPLKQQISVRYQDLIQKAGVSRGAIGPAIKEVIGCGFVHCDKNATQKTAGTSGNSAVYSLRWDGEGEYAKGLDDFNGFYTGEGHRTPVPNRFFDEVIPQESLSVVKVVGAVIRHTIGYQNQFGGRRMSSPLSYRRIQDYSQLSDRSTLAQAIRHAQQVGFIECVEAGQFNPDSNQQRTATYALRWLSSAENSLHSSKTRPASGRFKNPTSIGSETPPADRFKNQTSKKDTLKNRISKQQDAAVLKAVSLLTDAGMDRVTAIALAQKRGLVAVENQLGWLEARYPSTNRIGMLRKAVDEDWPKPASVVDREKRSQERLKHRQQNNQRHEEETAITEEKRRRQQRRERLLTEWGSASLDRRQQWIQMAVERETSGMIRGIIRRDSPSTPKPHVQVLEIVAMDCNLPPVVKSSASVPPHSSDAEVAARSESSKQSRQPELHEEKIAPQRMDIHQHVA